MITLVQTATSTIFSVIVEQKSTTINFVTPVSQGNLIVVIGSFLTGASPTVGVNDNSGNSYVVVQPLSDGTGSDYWMAMTVASVTFNVQVNVVYSNFFGDPVICISEFNSSFNWVTPSLLDGSSAQFSASSNFINSGTITTVNGDDLIVAGYLFPNPILGSITLSAGWNFVGLSGKFRGVAWTEVAPAGPIAFMATQSIAGDGTQPAATAYAWAIQSNLVLPTPTLITITTASINPTAFIETYPNRVPEDVYDSLSGNPQFVYVKYGPSYTFGN